MNIKILNKAVCIYAFFAVLSVALLITVSTTIQAQVSPTRIKLETKPGEKVPFNFNIINKNNEQRSYAIAYSYYTQDKDGYQKEIKVTSDNQSGAWDWINLDNKIKPNERFDIKSKEKFSLSGVINVPRKRSKSVGFHNIIVSVTEFAPQQKKSGVTLNYASASIIELTVLGVKRRPRYLVENTAITADKESNSSTASIEYLNQSNYKGRLLLKMQLRREKRLIASIPLLTNESSNGNHHYSSIFPNNRVKLTGSVEKILLPGDYDMRIVGEFGGSKLRTFKKTITVN
jgi:hypothetical protein